MYMSCPNNAAAVSGLLGAFGIARRPFLNQLNGFYYFQAVSRKGLPFLPAALAAGTEIAVLTQSGPGPSVPPGSCAPVAGSGLSYP